LRHIDGGADGKDRGRLNIEHYKRMLATETDEAKRKTLMQLLAEEEAKLRSVPDPKTEKRSS
jgi:hypothetical protein